MIRWISHRVQDISFKTLQILCKFHRIMPSEFVRPRQRYALRQTVIWNSFPMLCHYNLNLKSMHKYILYLPDTKSKHAPAVRDILRIWIFTELYGQMSIGLYVPEALPEEKEVLIPTDHEAGGWGRSQNWSGCFSWKEQIASLWWESYHNLFNLQPSLCTMLHLWLFSICVVMQQLIQPESRIVHISISSGTVTVII